MSFLNDFTNYQGVKQIFNTNEFFNDFTNYQAVITEAIITKLTKLLITLNFFLMISLITKVL